MEGKMKCPICGKENKRIYDSEDIGLVEDYYSCDNCGYNLEMCYSPIHEWIELDKWNINKLKELWNSQSINTKPVRYGQWIFGKDLPYSWGQIPKNKYHLYCSECLEQAFNRSEDNDPDFDVDTSYCPNCGAKMIEVSGGE